MAYKYQPANKWHEGRNIPFHYFKLVGGSPVSLVVKRVRRQVLDKEGRPVYDENRKPVYETVYIITKKVFLRSVREEPFRSQTVETKDKSEALWEVNSFLED